jgi:hypothetical protein
MANKKVDKYTTMLLFLIHMDIESKQTSKKLYAMHSVSLGTMHHLKPGKTFVV